MTQTRTESLRSEMEVLRDEKQQLQRELEESKTALLRLQDALQQREQEAELACFRAVEAERRKWEARETRLMAILEGQRRDVSTKHDSSRGTIESVPVETVTLDGSADAEVGAVGGARGVTPHVENSVTDAMRQEIARGSTTETDVLGNQPGVGRASSERVVREDWTTATTFVTNSLPPLAKFSGETAGEEETFGEWIEQFEMVGSLCKWNERTKLVNLVTRLKGPAYAYYRSCDDWQRTDYSKLVEGLRERFTPVHIGGVQSSLFHERRQKPGETVDLYAQQLKTLFRKAYPMAQRGNEEAQSMGRSVLVFQFVAGLRAELKAKLAGAEGDFDHLLIKARFEETKLKELPTTPSPWKGRGQVNNGKSLTEHMTLPVPKKGDDKRESTSNQTDTSSDKPGPSIKGSCFHCGQVGHMARYCKARKTDHQEASGKRVAALAVNRKGEEPAETGSVSERVSGLRRQLREAELSQALEEGATTLHGINARLESQGKEFGKRLQTEVTFEGCQVQAFVDTGSPVTIVSLKLAIKALKQQRKSGQTPTAWKEEARKRLKEPSTVLQGYGGGRLNTVAQLEATVNRGPFSKKATVYVQSDTPVDMLLGTDCQSALGLHLLEMTSVGSAVDLLTGQQWNVEETSHTHYPSSGDETTERGQDDDVGLAGVTVHLLHATRVPARRMQLVKAQVEGRLEEALCWFEPEEGLSGDYGVIVEQGIVSLDPTGCVTLIAQNHGLEPLKLEEGLLIGRIQATSIAEEDNAEEIEQQVIPETKMDEQQVETEAAANNLDSHRIETLLGTVKGDIPRLKEAEAKALENLMGEFQDVFALDSSELGMTQLVTHSIETGDQVPIRQAPRRIPFVLRKKVEGLVEEMMNQGLIEPSRSPWSSPVVLVTKKDGGTRFCVDYRRLNAATKVDAFPLPRVDDSLDLLADTKFFTTLDLASGYWQVPMHPLSKEKTAFVTHCGSYEFRVMPFGLCNGPSTFQRLMETVLGGLARDICMVYLDDILVLGKTLDEHLENLRQVFDRLREAGLRLKPEKCHFVKEEAEYLGYVVTAQGLKAEERKVEAIRNFPSPNTLKALRAFLGLASYYRRFIPSFSRIASPLFALTRKDVPFEWSLACQAAFDRLKEILTEAPVLAFPRFDRGFILETDASGEGLGAVLAQEQPDDTIRPIAYASRTLQPHERNYGVTELEALAVVWSAKHFRPYLYGNRCTVYTDHEALKALLNTPQPSGKLARWGLVLQEIDIHIRYRPGKTNANADFLSRYPQEGRDSGEPEYVVAVVTSDGSLARDGDGELKSHQQGDSSLKAIIDFLREGTLPQDEKQARTLSTSQSNYALIDGVLYHVEPDKSLRVIPATADRKSLFREAHAGLFGGHLRDAKIHSQLARHYWWPSMRKDIKSWCRECLECARRRVGTPLRPPLVPIPVAGAFDRVGVDIIQFPKSNSGNRYAIVFMDYLTKWPEVFASPDQSALSIARFLVEHIVSRHGVPRELLSDRGAAFLSCLLKEVSQLMGLHKVSTTAYHPQTDGLVERFHRTLTDMLAKTVEANGCDWDERLPYVLFAYRASVQESTGESPFFLLYGRDPQLPTEAARAPPVERSQLELSSYQEEMVSRLGEAWQLARSHIQRAQKKQKKYYDQRSQNISLKVGERVFLQVPSLGQGKAYKFAKPFRGPFRIVQVYDNGADIRPTDKPQAATIRVALNRLRRCPDELEQATPEGNEKDGQLEVAETRQASVRTTGTNQEPRTWAGRLRRRAPIVDDVPRDGDM